MANSLCLMLPQCERIRNRLHRRTSGHPICWGQGARVRICNAAAGHRDYTDAKSLTAVIPFYPLRKNFSFKCHRDNNNNVFAVNAISFHPIHGTFSTAGADGTFSFWDKDSKQRLKPFPSVNGQITSTAFNRNGTIFAYSVSYDWSKVYVNALSLLPHI